jgi:hypothetical protein
MTVNPAEEKEARYIYDFVSFFRLLDEKRFFFFGNDLSNISWR